MTPADRVLLAWRDDCWSHAAQLIGSGVLELSDLARPWLRRAAILHVDLRRRGALR